jgi:hypothetical protein
MFTKDTALSENGRARHGRGTAWARHCVCELALTPTFVLSNKNDRTNFVPSVNYVEQITTSYNYSAQDVGYSSGVARREIFVFFRFLKKNAEIVLQNWSQSPAFQLIIH